MSFNTSESWIMLSPIEQSIKQKIEAVGTPLKDWDIKIYRGVLTGLNEAFIISEEKRNEILENCKTEDERERTAELIRPVLRGKDIKRYGYEWAHLYIINTHNGIPQKNIAPISIDKYPAVKNHLDSFMPKLRKRDDQGITPYNLRSCAYWEEFNKPKLVYKEISKEISFALSLNQEFLSNSAYSISGPSIDTLKYLLDVLNSKLTNWYCRTFFTSLENNAVRMLAVSVNTIPIIRPKQRITIERILNLDKSKIDVAIYNMYGLSKIEQEYIDDFS